jgi:phenylacetic acid degradation operon negative regulatory protein
LQYAANSPVKGAKGVDQFGLAARQILDGFRQRRPLRAGSLIVSFFGDVVAPRGGSIWLGGLIEALEPMGVSGRLVRTSIYRLAQDGWFDVHKMGRKSYYRLSDEGDKRFRRATQRIYSRPRDDWQGEWLMVLLSSTPSAHRDTMRRELAWMGFGALTPGLMGRPVADGACLEQELGEFLPPPLAYRARLMDGVAESRVENLIRSSWTLAETEQGYQRFLKLFSPLLGGASGQDSLPGELSLLLRVLMIHEYRRILLRDPQLPAALLPADWHGQLAYELCQALYRVLLAPSELHISRSLVAEGGPLPPPDTRFFRRFGGLVEGKY